VKEFYGGFMMPEKKINSKLVELSTSVLDNDKINDFLDFVSFLINNELSLQNKSTYSWWVSYKKARICTINLYGEIRYKPDGSWSIYPKGEFFTEYDKYVIDADVRKLILNSLNFNLCDKCKGDGCANFEKRQYRTTIFGKNCSSICSGIPIKIINPCGQSLEYAKHLILITKNIIADI